MKKVAFFLFFSLVMVPYGCVCLVSPTLRNGYIICAGSAIGFLAIITIRRYRRDKYNRMMKEAARIERIIEEKARISFAKMQEKERLRQEAAAAEIAKRREECRLRQEVAAAEAIRRREEDRMRKEEERLRKKSHVDAVARRDLDEINKKLYECKKINDELIDFIKNITRRRL